MALIERITMTMRELDRFKVIQDGGRADYVTRERRDSCRVVARSPATTAWTP